MASRVMDAGGPMQQQSDAPSFTEQDGMTVLNAVSNLTLQRTIVEAFVKLIVCRKVTVQKVAAASGHVLDSQTTQEEESPVILDVHHHETSDVCSALGSCLAKPTTHSTQHVPSDSATHQTTSVSAKKGEFFKKNHSHTNKGGNCHGDMRRSRATGSGLEITDSVDTLSGNGSRCNNRFLENNLCEDSEDGSHVRSTVLDNTEKRTVEYVTQQREDHHHSTNQTLCRKQQEASDDGPAAQQTYCSAEQGKNKSLHVCESEERHTEEETNCGFFSIPAPCAFSVSPASKRPASFHTDGQEGIRKKTTTSQDSPSLSEEQKEPAADELSEKTTDLSGKKPKEDAVVFLQDNDSSHSPQEVTPEQQELNVDCEDTGMETETQICNGDDYGSEQEPAHVKINEEHSLGSKVSNAEDSEENMLSDDKGTHLSPASQSPGNSEHADEEGYTICLETDEEELATTKQERLQEEEGETTEYDYQTAERDHEVSSRPSSQTQPHTSDHQTRTGQLARWERSSEKETDTSEPTSLSAPSETIGHDQEPAEKLDPFAHLFEASFPPLDRTHYDTPLPAGKDGKVHTVVTKKDINISRKTGSVADIKQEPDDDCMITAAFISPSPRKKHHSSGSASHTTTSPSGTVSIGQDLRMRNSNFFGRAVQDRRDVIPGSWGQGPAVRQQLRHAPQVPQTGSPRASLYQGPLAHSGTSSPQDSSASSHVPNFLAPSSQAGPEPVSHGALPATPEEGTRAISSSQQAFHQCGLCCKIFMHRHKFDMHVMICGGHRPFKCRICSKGFNQRAHLDTHMKFHIGIKRYRCDLCRKAYVMKGDLIRHMKTRVHRQAMQFQGLSPLPP